MKTFRDLDAYLKHYSANREPALIPIETVARYRKVANVTAKRMLGDGRLEGVDIDGDLYATVDSYLSLKKSAADRVEKVKRFIELHARKGTIVTYGPVMEQVGLNWRSPPDRRTIGAILGEISTASYTRDRIFLTAIVHKRYGAGTKPGDGYFGLVRQITGEKPEGDEAAAVHAEVQRVVAHYRGAPSGV